MPSEPISAVPGLRAIEAEIRQAIHAISDWMRKGCARIGLPIGLDQEFDLATEFDTLLGMVSEFAPTVRAAWAPAGPPTHYGYVGHKPSKEYRLVAIYKGPPQSAGTVAIPTGGGAVILTPRRPLPAGA